MTLDCGSTSTPTTLNQGTHLNLLPSTCIQSSYEKVINHMRMHERLFISNNVSHVKLLIIKHILYWQIYPLMWPNKVLNTCKCNILTVYPQGD